MGTSLTYIFWTNSYATKKTKFQQKNYVTDIQGQYFTKQKLEKKTLENSKIIFYEKEKRQRGAQ